MIIYLRGIAAPNTGASTLAFQGGAALAIVDPGGALAANEIIAAAPAHLMYQHATTNWLLLNPAVTCY